MIVDSGRKNQRSANGMLSVYWKTLTTKHIKKYDVIEKVQHITSALIHIMQKAGYDFSFSIVNFPFITSNIPAF
jgi:hypothetical protein